MTDNTTEHPAQWGTTLERPSRFHRVHNALSRYVSSIDATEIADRVNHPARAVRKYHQAVGRRSQESIRQRVREGWWFGTTPYGYQVRQRRDIDGWGRAGHRRWLTDPRRGPVVPVIFDLASTTNWTPAPSSRTWPVTPTNTQVRSMGNPVYTGRAVWGRTRAGRAVPRGQWIILAPGAHDPLVDDRTFARAAVGVARASTCRHAR